MEVVFIILSPSTLEASHTELMRQFELYANITPLPTYITHVRCRTQSGRLRLFTYVPRQASERLNMARNIIEIRPPTGFEPSPNQRLPSGSRHAIY